MSPEEARTLLQEAVGEEDPVFLPPAVLKDLTIDDLPEDLQLEIGTQKDDVLHVDWDGTIVNAGGKLQAFARNLYTRKYGTSRSAWRTISIWCDERLK